MGVPGGASPAAATKSTYYNPPPVPPSTPGKSKKPKLPKKPGDADLSHLMTYGPGYLPLSYAWTDSRIEQVRHFKHWVYVAVDTIATAIASSAPNVSYILNSPNKPLDPNDKAAQFAAWKRRSLSILRRRHFQSRALTPLHAHDSMEPAEPDHPLCELLRNPNEPDTSFDLWYETALFLELTGIAYWYTPKHGLGLPYAAFVVPSHWMWPIGGGPEKAIAGWDVRPTEGNYLRKFIPADQIIVFKRKNPISKIDGYAPSSAAAPWIDTQESIEKSRLSAYRRGSFPSVAIQFDGSMEDPSDEALRRIETKYISRYSGEFNFAKPLFLPPGVSIKPLQIKPAEMLWGESSSETRKNILAAYKVPEAVAALSDRMTYGSLRAAYFQFYSSAVNPTLRYFASVLSEKLCPLYSDNLRCWWEDQTPHDPEILERQIQTDLMGACLTINEQRALRGREPFPWDWADRPLAPVNMASVSESGPFGGASDPQLPTAEPKQPRISDES